MRTDYQYDEHLKNHILEQVLDTPQFKAFYLKNPKYGRMESCMIIFSPEGINILGDLCPGNDNRNSGCHAYGYGLDWFAGHLSSSYLCEKFLCKQWHVELAVDSCRARAEQIMLGETQYFDHDKELEAILSSRQDLAETIRDLRSDLRGKLAEPSDVLPAIAEARQEGKKSRAILMDLREKHAQDYLDLAYELDGGDIGVETFGRRMSEIDSDFYECAPGYGYQPRARGLLVALQKKFSELYHKMRETAPVGAP